MFKNVNPGDQWVEFAYIRDEENEEACSLVCGIYRCVRRCWAGVVPRKSRTKYWSREWGKHAWMIKGRKHGYQPPFGPVSVRPIDTILGRTLTKRATVIKLKGGLKEFQAICREVKSRAFNPAAIPVLGREPENEQEVLMIVIGAHQQIGIGKILRVRTGFPDMLAVVGRKEVHFELEYDSKTFKAHFPDLRRVGKRRRQLLPMLQDRSDGREVAVLCWVNGDVGKKLTGKVQNLRIFELQTLLGEHRRIKL